jgi:predicted nucleic acid-binding protein
MAANALADAGFLVALMSERDGHHDWARAQAVEYPPVWQTCEAVLSETFHLLGPRGTSAIAALLQRGRLLVRFDFTREQEAVLTLMQKYREVPMSLADACLVRMTETLPDPVVLTTDMDFRVYRRHSRQVVPSIMPR